MSIAKKVACAAVAALALIGANIVTAEQADARPFRSGFHGRSIHTGFHRGFAHRGFYRSRFAPRVFTGIAFGGLGYRYAAPYYADCFIERRLFRDRFGRRYTLPVRVCV